MEKHPKPNIPKKVASLNQGQVEGKILEMILPAGYKRHAVYYTIDIYDNGRLALSIYRSGAGTFIGEKVFQITGKE